MNFNKIIVENEKYYLNKYQYFYINKKEITKILNQINWPAIIVDTEFFNKSHNKEEIQPTLYNDTQKDLVYILQYSFAKNLEEIYNRINRKAIKSLAIKRNYNDKTYDFFKQYNLLKKSFINMCINKKIKTIIFAGQSNDKKIIESWVNENKNLLKNKKSDLFILDKTTNEYKINSLDIYQVLNHLSFVNLDNQNQQFYNPKNIQKGWIGENTITIPSLRKFIDYAKDIFNDSNLNDTEDIYLSCCNALKLFSLDKINIDEFEVLNKSVKLAKTHCFNDVLKILYLIDFIYAFSKFKNTNNKYIKKD
ncbi:hypothetical protein [Mycoplasma mycoides]|nr:hypothetical protein [Mycoplasma mycoides]